MALIENFLITGALTGAVYALLALGFTLIYGVAGVVNMAHGALFMLGAFMFFAFGPIGYFGLDVYSALALAAIFVAVAGSILYLLTIHQVIKDMLAVLVVTIGVALLFQQVINIVFVSAFGSAYQAIPSLMSGYQTLADVRVPNSQLLVAGVSIVLFAVIWAFTSKLKMGRAMRAVAQDREAAMLMGINTTRLYMVTMAMSAALAAIAGIFIASSFKGGTIDPAMWLNPLVMSFAIVVLGGLGSIKGTLLGAFIIGYVGTAVIVFLPENSFLASAFALVIMVLVLLIRPRGIFGKRIELE